MALLGLTDCTKLMNLLVLQVAPCNLLQLHPTPATHTHARRRNKQSVIFQIIRDQFIVHGQYRKACWTAFRTMFIELVDEAIFFSSKFYEKAGKLILSPKTEECSYLKNVGSCSFLLSYMALYSVYLEIISWLLGPNIVWVIAYFTTIWHYSRYGLNPITLMLPVN